MTYGGSERRTVLRTVLAVVVVLDLLSFFFFLGEDRGIGTTHGTLNAFNDLVSGTAVRGVVVLTGVAAAVAFGRRAGRVWEGVIALAALALLSTAHAQLFGSPWRHLYFSGVCLLGWLLGLAVSRHRGAPTDESYARMGSIALLGATYLNAGISKIAFGGLDWLSGLPIQAVIVAQDGLVTDGVLSLYRWWVVETPAVARLLTVATVGFELAGPLLILGRIPRACVALGLVAMHANIYLLTQILYWEPMVFLLAFGLSSDAPSSATVERSTASSRSDDRPFAAAAALLALCAVLAVGHQARRHAQLQAAKAAERERSMVSAPSMPITPSPPSRRQIGPFAVGQPVAEGWTVDALELRDDGFVATLSGTRGRAAFELTCAASAHRSPFDVGAAHIFYSKDVEFDEVEGAGRAIQDIVQKATEGRDVCDLLASWSREAADQAVPADGG